MDLGGGCGGCAAGGVGGGGGGGGTPPPPTLRGLLTTGTLQNMQICMVCILSSSRHVIAKSKAFFYVFTFKISLHHQLVTPFLSGASPLKKNPGSVPEISYTNSVSP